MSTQLNYQNFIKELSDNLKSINQKVLLVAVSKTKPLRDILGLYSLGQRDFGENYAQELRDKIKATTKHQDDISWHYIGQIQQNKIKYFEGGAQGEHKLARGFKPFNTYSNHYIAQPDFRSAISNFLNDELSKINEYSNELEERTPYKKLT